MAAVFSFSGSMGMLGWIRKDCQVTGGKGWGCAQESRLIRNIWNFTLVTSQFEKLNGLNFWEDVFNISDNNLLQLLIFGHSLGQEWNYFLYPFWLKRSVWCHECWTQLDLKEHLLNFLFSNSAVLLFSKAYFYPYLTLQFLDLIL